MISRLSDWTWRRRRRRRSRRVGGQSVVGVEMETSTLERDESRPPLMTITDELRVGERRRRRRYWVWRVGRLHHT